MTPAAECCSDIANLLFEVTQQLSGLTLQFTQPRQIGIQRAGRNVDGAALHTAVGGTIPRWPYAFGVTLRPRGVRSIMPICIR